MNQNVNLTPGEDYGLRFTKWSDYYKPNLAFRLVPKYIDLNQFDTGIYKQLLFSHPID